MEVLKVPAPEEVHGSIAKQAALATKTRKDVGLLTILGGTALAMLLLISLICWLLGIPSCYPDASANFSFSKFGLWGKSPAEILEQARRSNDIAEVYAALDALALIGVHYDNRPDTTTLALEEIKQIYELSNGPWAERPLEMRRSYTPFQPWQDHSLKHQLSFGQSTKLGVYSSVSSMRDVVHHHDLPSLQAECDRYLLEIRPPPASPLHEVWLLITQVLLKKDPDALKALRNAIERDSRMASGDESGAGN